MSLAIEFSGVTKRFGRLEVLRGIDLAIEPGRVTAFVGPNAAGKSTLIKMLLGLVRPGAGQVRVGNDRVNGAHRYREQIGYMPQSGCFPDRLTGREVLAFLTRLRGRLADVDLTLVEAFGLEPHLDKPIRTLSGGTRQKLSAVVAFLFRPEILVLDEPTAGLDPLASSVLKQRIRGAVQGGATVLLTSHVVSELEDLADHIVFLLEGRVEYQGSVASLVAQSEEGNLERALAGLLGRARR